MNLLFTMYFISLGVTLIAVLCYQSDDEMCKYTAQNLNLSVIGDSEKGIVCPNYPRCNGRLIRQVRMVSPTMTCIFKWVIPIVLFLLRYEPKIMMFAWSNIQRWIFISSSPIFATCWILFSALRRLLNAPFPLFFLVNLVFELCFIQWRKKKCGYFLIMLLMVPVGVQCQNATRERACKN